MYNPGQELSTLNFGAIIGGPLKAVVEAQSQAAHTTVDFIKAVGFEQGVVSEDGKSTTTGKPIYVSFKYPKEVAPFIPSAPESLRIIVNISGAGYLDNAKNSLIDCLYFGADPSVNRLPMDKLKIDYDANGGLKSVEISEFTEDIRKLVASESDSRLSVKMKDNKEAATKAELVATYQKAAASTPAVYQDMQIEVPILTMMPIPYIKIKTADIELNVKINSVSNTSSSNESSSNVSSSTNASYSAWYSPFKVSTSINASYSSQSKSSSTEEVKKDYSLNIKVRAEECEMPAGMSRILDILEASIVNKPLVAA